MSNRKTLKALFTALHGSLPYEYDEEYVDVADIPDIIVISKKDSDRTIYITSNAPDDNAIFEIALYDDENDDPAETTQWDADGHDSTLIDLIAYIEKTL